MFPGQGILDSQVSNWDVAFIITLFVLIVTNVASYEAGARKMNDAWEREVRKMLRHFRRSMK